MQKELEQLIEKWRKYLADFGSTSLSETQQGAKYAKRECAQELAALLTSRSSRAPITGGATSARRL